MMTTHPTDRVTTREIELHVPGGGTLTLSFDPPADLALARRLADVVHAETKAWTAERSAARRVPPAGESGVSKGPGGR